MRRQPPDILLTNYKMLDYLCAITPMVIVREPGRQRLLMDPQISSRLSHGLIGLDRQFDRAFFAFRTLRLRRLCTHWTDLTRSLISLVSRCPVKYSHITSIGWAASGFPLVTYAAV